MLLSKSGPTDICPHPLPAIRSHDRTPMPTERGAKCSATPTGAAYQMLRQITSAVKLRCAKLGVGSRALRVMKVGQIASATEPRSFPGAAGLRFEIDQHEWHWVYQQFCAHPSCAGVPIRLLSSSTIGGPWNLMPASPRNLNRVSTIERSRFEREPCSISEGTIQNAQDPASPSGRQRTNF